MEDTFVSPYVCTNCGCGAIRYLGMLVHVRCAGDPEPCYHVDMLARREDWSPVNDEAMPHNVSRVHFK